MTQMMHETLFKPVFRILHAAARKVLQLDSVPDGERFFACAIGSYIRGKENTGVLQRAHYFIFEHLSTARMMNTLRSATPSSCAQANPL